MSTNSTSQALGSQQNRPTIGFIVDDISLSYQQSLWQAINQAAQHNNAHLITIAGVAIQKNLKSGANQVYQLIGSTNLDGVIIATGTIFPEFTEEEIVAYLRQFTQRPMVSIGVSMDSIPSLVVNNRSGMQQAVSHLIQDHNRRRIAFIQQYAGNPEAEARYNGYRDALAEFDILFDPNLIVPPQYTQAEAAVSLLLDERDTMPDAIVSVDDLMALNVIDALNQRGLRIPQDIAVCGFDNIDASQVSTPPLTTVHQPILEMGQIAVANILDQISGKNVPLQTSTKTKFEKRQSCGCKPERTIVIDIAPIPAQVDPSKLETYRPTIQNAIRSAVPVNDKFTWAIEELYQVFASTVNTAQLQDAIDQTEEILLRVSLGDKNTQKWQKALHVLQQYTHNFTDASAQNRANQYLQQARLILSEISYRNQAQEQLSSRDRAMLYRQWGQSVTTAPDMDAIRVRILNGLPGFGLSYSRIVLRDDANPGMFSTLLELPNRPNQPPAGAQYAEDDLIATSIPTKDGPNTLVLQPLFFGEINFGYIFLSDELSFGSSYRTIADYISSGLHNLSLMMETNRLLEHTRALYKSGRNLLEGLNFEDTIQNAVKSALTGLKADLVGANIINFEEKTVEYIYYEGKTVPAAFETISYDELQQGLFGEAIRQRQMVASPKSAMPDPRETPALQQARQTFGIGAILIVPLQYRGQLFGTLTAINQLEHPDFDHDSINLLYAIASQASAALSNARMFEEMEIQSAQNQKRAAQLAAAGETAQAISTILDTDELLSKLVDVLQDRFGLDFCGLYLLDEEKRWAELMAGTGQAGQALLERSWKLERGGNSMIGRCVQTGKPDIQLNVDQAPIHLRNPELPNTKSEMALPLITRGNIIGAISIQSNAENAFNSDDIKNLETMANQLANAIENSRLIQRLSREQTFMDAMMENLPDAIYFKDIDSRFLRVSQYMVDKYTTTGIVDEIIGKTDFDLFTQSHAESAYRDEQKIIQSGEPILNLEEVETFEDGTELWVLTSKLPLRDARNEIIGTFGVSRDITARKTIEQTAQKRAQQLEAVAEIAETISAILDLDIMFPRIVNLIRERFNLYYAGIFLTDESGEYARLKAGTGEAGARMLAENWQLEISDQNMIGNCIATRKADIQLDINVAAIHLRNPYLPDTRSEMALPLMIRGSVLGALTIQSTAPNAFSAEDAITLQTMANQIASAIENTRLYEQTQSALVELQATQRRYLIQAWNEYNHSQPAAGYKKVDAEIIPLGDEKLPEVNRAMRLRRSTVIRKDNEEVLAVPILLRDEPIGALGFSLPAGKKTWTKEDIDMAETISEQFGLAAESLRLLNETQKRAARERLVTEITTKIRSSSDPQAMLQTAILELREALSVPKAQVIIKKQE